MVDSTLKTNSKSYSLYRLISHKKYNNQETRSNSSMRGGLGTTSLGEGWYSTDGSESRRKLRDHRGIRKRASEPRGRLIIRRISGGPQTTRWWRCR